MAAGGSGALRPESESSSIPASSGAARLAKASASRSSAASSSAVSRGRVEQRGQLPPHAQPETGRGGTLAVLAAGRDGAARAAAGCRVAHCIAAHEAIGGLPISKQGHILLAFVLSHAAPQVSRPGPRELSALK